MLKHERIEIAFEIARAFLCGNFQNQTAWCAACESAAPLVTLQMAAALEKTNNIVIFRRVETGELHHKVTVGGELLICFTSLLETNRSSADAKFIF